MTQHAYPTDASKLDPTLRIADISGVFKILYCPVNQVIGMDCGDGWLYLPWSVHAVSVFIGGIQQRGIQFDPMTLVDWVDRITQQTMDSQPDTPA